MPRSTITAFAAGSAVAHLLQAVQALFPDLASSMNGTVNENSFVQTSAIMLGSVAINQIAICLGWFKDKEGEDTDDTNEPMIS